MPPEILTTNTIPPTEAAHLAFGDEAKEGLISSFQNLGITASPQENANALDDLRALGGTLGETLAPLLACTPDMRPFDAAMLIGALLELDSDLDSLLRKTPFYESGTSYLLQGVADGAALTSTSSNS